MDRSNTMAPAAAAAVCTSPDGEGQENARSSILLDVRAYSAAHRDSSAACSRTSTGHAIEVTLFAAPPPALSHLSVHCPGLHLPPDDLSFAPKAIAAADDLLLLRVPVDPHGKYFHRHNDYFVYVAHPEHPKLHLLPNPSPACFGDDELAVLRRGDDAQYVVAALTIRPFTEHTFTLHLCSSMPGGEPGSWTSQLVTVEEPLRDTVCPVPDTAQRLMYHLTTKVIAIGGNKGTVGWVDLWRGILLCDVLEEAPKLRDMPLPLPAKGNWRRIHNGCPYYRRDIAVGKHKDSIRYVEMEVVQPRVVSKAIPRPEPGSYLEWLRRRECAPQLTHSFVHGSCKLTTWSMPIPVASWDDWSHECTAELGDIDLDNPGHYGLLQKLASSGDNQEAKAADLSLGCLRMVYPALSVDDDDVVFLLSKAVGRGKMGVMIAVDVRRKELQGVAELDGNKITSFKRCYIASGIPEHYNTGGTRESLKQAAEHMPKPRST
ncbi:hypothetical protein ACP70R_041947 [Stipagrostis hirtigluma subsp. patula]